MIDMFYLCLFAGAFAGGFVNGLTGFGTALFALGWWLQVMPPREAVAMVLMASVVVGVQGTIEIWSAINWRRLARFVIPAGFGIPFGLAALAYIDARQLAALVGVLLVAYGGYFAFRRNLPVITGAFKTVDVGLGFAGGALGAMAGLSGVLPSMWCAMRPWPKREQRGVLQPFNMAVLGVAIAGLAIDGAYTRTVATNLAIALPVSLLAGYIGLRVFRRLSDAFYRRLVIVMMLVSGVALLLRTMAW